MNTAISWGVIFFALKYFMGGDTIRIRVVIGGRWDELTGLWRSCAVHIALKPAAANVPTNGYKDNGRSSTENIVYRLSIPRVLLM